MYAVHVLPARPLGALSRDNPVVRPAHTRRSCSQILAPSFSNPLFESYQISRDTPATGNGRSPMCGCCTDLGFRVVKT